MTSATHGGNVYALARERRWPLRRIMDFSASINPLGPSSQSIAAATKALSQIVHYPDPDCLALRAAVSRHYGIPADMVVVGNGSTELIHLLPEVVELERALIIGPTFSEYARAIHQHGGKIMALQAQRRTAFTPPMDEAIRLVRTSTSELTGLVLCNPNSPTGRMVTAAQVRELVAAAARRKIWMIVDETFAEYCEGCSVLADTRRQRRLIVLRSFTKFYAVPGLRVGYLVASSAVAARMRVRLPPWSVNGVAQAAGCAALNDFGHARRSLSFMTQERARFSAQLQRLSGVTVYPSKANFLLLELSRSATPVVEVLRRSGVLVRDCSGIPGLSNRTIRVAIRTRNDNERLCRLLRRALR